MNFSWLKISSFNYRVSPRIRCIFFFPENYPQKLLCFLTLEGQIVLNPYKCLANYWSLLSLVASCEAEKAICFKNQHQLDAQSLLKTIIVVLHGF
jgi:hypothetical protein